MPLITVVMPVYNVQNFVADAVRSVLAQSFSDFELLVVDDCSPDNSVAICEAFEDPRIRILRHHENRGLAGARNSGVRAARGQFIAFLDSDDLWHPLKLERHLCHFAQTPALGLSFSRSAFIDADGSPNSCYQMPQLTHIEPGYLFCRNPVGNGSAPVMRRAALDAIAFEHSHNGRKERCYFDPTLRRSEDIECWVRLALISDWLIEGIPEPLTLYRLNAGGLSAQLYKQLESWEAVAAKTATYAPQFIATWGPVARAYQLRYLARQAIRLNDGDAAVALLHRALRCHWRIIAQEPMRTLTTTAAACLLKWLPALYRNTEGAATQLIGRLQQRRIQQDLCR